jgi:hypothetical protein
MGRVCDGQVLWVGVDAGKGAHHAVAVDEQGRSVWSVRVPNGQAEIEQLIERSTALAVLSGDVGQPEHCRRSSGSARRFLTLAVREYDQALASLLSQLLNRITAHEAAQPGIVLPSGPPG